MVTVDVSMADTYIRIQFCSEIKEQNAKNSILCQMYIFKQAYTCYYSAMKSKAYLLLNMKISVHKL